MKEKIKITVENIGQIFNESLYPTLDKCRTQKEVSTFLSNVLKEYLFETELDKIRLLIPTINQFTKNLLTELGINYADLKAGTRQQIGWNFVNEWFNGGAFMPMKLINYADILSYKSEQLFEYLKFIDPETVGWLIKEATFILDGVERGEFEVDAEQKEHLQKIKDGNLPFNLVKVEVKK